MHIFLIWMIALISILLMLFRPKNIPEYIWISAGAILMVVTRLLPLDHAVHAIHEALDVCLFLFGMMLLAELARHEGVFDWVADIAVRHAQGSASRLFFWVYGVGTVVTALLSNDATAVVLTPAVLAAVRRARVEPRPYLLACALIANAASFVLPISNPANLVIFGAGLPSLVPWLRMLLLPSLVSIVATFVCLRWVSRETLAGRTEAAGDPVKLTPAGRVAFGGILMAAAALLVSSALGISLGAPTCVAGIVALCLVALKDRSAPRAALQDISWGVLPLVAGLFMLVEALNLAGMMHAAQAGLRWLTTLPAEYGKFLAAFSTALLSNGMNNLPVGLASGTALQQAHSAAVLTHAVLIGVDLGPNLSVTGSLATILWLIALRRDHAEMTAWEFLKVGVVVMPIALALTLLALR